MHISIYKYKTEIVCIIIVNHIMFGSVCLLTCVPIVLKKKTLSLLKRVFWAMTELKIRKLNITNKNDWLPELSKVTIDQLVLMFYFVLQEHKNNTRLFIAFKHSMRLLKWTSNGGQYVDQ